MSKHYTKVTINSEFKDLDAWKQNPRGYAVAVYPGFVHIEVDDSWKNVQVVEVNVDDNLAVKLFDRFRGAFDVDPNGFRPRLFVITRSAFEDPRSEQFVRRAAVIIERF